MNGHTHHCSECGDQVAEYCDAHPSAMIESVPDHRLRSHGPIRDLLRQARADQASSAPAIDALLLSGYSLKRAEAACRPYQPPSLFTRWQWAAAAYSAATDAYNECECGLCAVTDTIECERYTAYVVALAAMEQAKDDVADSDEPRDYTIRDSHGGDWTILSCPSDLHEDVVASVRDGDWGDGHESWVWNGRSRDVVTGDEELHKVVFDAKEPPCKQDEHRWVTPYDLLGGLRENPGVWSGDNGGTTAREVCEHCGVYRVSRSRKTNRSNGTTFAATDYEVADDDSLEWVRNHEQEPDE